MKQRYTPLFLLFFLTSCFAKIGYVGSSYTPTTNVDVFIDESSIKKTYDIVGKGYPRFAFITPEQIQSKAVAKAKQKGVDAVLIKDYYIPATGANINTTVRTDSVGKGVVSVGNTSVTPTASSGFIVLFLKYK
jgi:hypothetical protein